MKNLFTGCLISALLFQAGLGLAAEMPGGSATAKTRPGPQALAPNESRIDKLEFKATRMVDVMRTLSEMTNANIVVTEEAGKKQVTVFLKNLTVREAVETISKNAGLWYRVEKDGRTYRVMTTDEYQGDMVVYREDETRVFKLLHPNPTEVAMTIGDIYGMRVMMPMLCDPATDPQLSGATSGGMGGIGGGRGGMAGGRGGMAGGRGGMAGGRGGMAGGRGGMAGGRGGMAGGRGGMAGGRGGMAGGRGGMAGGMGRGGMGRGGIGMESELLINEYLTPDQIARLEESIGTDGTGTVSSEDLSTVTRSEPPIYLSVNCEHNLIILRTSDMAAIRDIEALIQKMDRPAPQVLLEMRIMEVSMDDNFKQLFRLSGISGNGKHIFDFGFPSEPGASLAYTFINDTIRARLEMMQENNQAQVLSSPVLLASNNRMSEVFVGTEQLLVTDWEPGQFFPATTTSAAYTIPPSAVSEMTDIGPRLAITPKINADKTVTIQIDQEVSSIKEDAAVIPVTVYNTDGTATIVEQPVDGRNVVRVNGIVTAKDGLTVAIAGLISSKELNNVAKVPILGDIPLVGELFTRKERSNAKSEMILLITPRIISNPTETEDVSRDVVEPITTQEW